MLSCRPTDRQRAATFQFRLAAPAWVAHASFDIVTCAASPSPIGFDTSRSRSRALRLRPVVASARSLEDSRGRRSQACRWNARNPQILPLGSRRRRWVCSFRRPQTARDSVTATSCRLQDSRGKCSRACDSVQRPVSCIPSTATHGMDRGWIPEPTSGYDIVSSQPYVAAELFWTD